MEDPKYLIFLELYYYLIKLKRAQICPFVATVKPRDAVAARYAGPPPVGSRFFQFHAVFGNIWQNRTYCFNFTRMSKISAPNAV